MASRAILLCLLVVLSTVFALPSGTGGGVYACFGDNWQGYCASIALRELDHCAVITDNEGHVARIGSLGPDLFVRCEIFASPGCQFKLGDVKWPGRAVGLPTFGSIKCRAVVMPHDVDADAGSHTVVKMDSAGASNEEHTTQLTRELERAEDATNKETTGNPHPHRPVPVFNDSNPDDSRPDYPRPHHLPPPVNTTSSNKTSNPNVISPAWPYVPFPLGHRPGGGDVSDQPDVVPDGTPGQGVTICDGEHFTGNCAYLSADSFTASPCKTILAMDPSTNQVVKFQTRSLAPDMYGRCVTYSGPGCYRDAVVDVKGYIPGGWGSGIIDFDAIYCFDSCLGCGSSEKM